MLLFVRTTALERRISQSHAACGATRPPSLRLHRLPASDRLLPHEIPGPPSPLSCPPPSRALSLVDTAVELSCTAPVAASQRVRATVDVPGGPREHDEDCARCGTNTRANSKGAKRAAGSAGTGSWDCVWHWDCAQTTRSPRSAELPLQ